MNVLFLPPNSPIINEVKKLWRKNSQTLGYFPNGAFSDHALKKRILVLLGEEENLLGYLIYRINKSGQAVIVHLCTEKNSQGKGYARALINRIIDFAKESNLKGIMLHCRRDNPAYNFWPKLGFAPCASKTGRGKDSQNLTLYWLNLVENNLLSIINEVGVIFFL